MAEKPNYDYYAFFTVCPTEVQILLWMSRNADEQNLLRISVAEDARKSYSPSGIDGGIDFDDDRYTLRNAVLAVCPRAQKYGESIDYQLHFGHQVGRRKASNAKHAQPCGPVGRKTTVCLLSDRLLGEVAFKRPLWR